jgi:hypothetical protein
MGQKPTKDGPQALRKGNPRSYSEMYGEERLYLYMKFAPNPNIDWSSTPELLDLEKLEYKQNEDFMRLAKAVFEELDKDLEKANKKRGTIATDDELMGVIKDAVASYKPRRSLTIFIHAYLRTRQHLIERIRERAM